MTNGLTWPSNRFFWAVVDAPAIRKVGPVPPVSMADLLDDIPVPVETLHAVCAPASSGRVVVCAIHRDSIPSAAEGANWLCPEAIPDHIAADLGPNALLPSSFNMLSGQFEPVGLKRARSRRRLLDVGCVLICVVLIALGLQRRIVFFHSVVLATKADTSEVIRAVGNSTTRESLERELAQLKAISDLQSKAPPPLDAAAVLSALLQSWPMTSACSPQWINVSQEAVSLSVTFEEDPGPFLRNFKPPQGWVLDEPRLNTTDHLVRVSLELRPKRNDSGGLSKEPKS